MATGTPPAGEPYGISTAMTDALNTKFTACENVIGAPASARSTRKAKTADLRPRFRAVGELLAGMDDLIIQITGTDEKDLFVDGYFNARRIGGSSGGREEGGTRSKQKMLNVSLGSDGKVASFNYSGGGTETRGTTQAEPKK
jgi:hypothetical protein